MPLPEIAAALSATSSAINLLKDINEATKQVQLNSIVLELQGKLIDINSKMLLIQSEFDNLTKAKAQVEEQLVDERQRNQDRDQYILESVGGSYAYRFAGQGRPDHYLCAACFDAGKKSILHVVYLQGGRDFQCKLCEDHNFFY